MLSSLKSRLGSKSQQQQQQHHSSSSSTTTTTRGSSHTNDDDLYNLPPKKIVKAIKPYYAQRAHELSFSTGDFFFVINEFDAMFEVVNPAARQRGLVPSSYFIPLDKLQLQQQQQQQEGVKRDSAFDSESRSSQHSSSSEGSNYPHTPKLESIHEYPFSKFEPRTSSSPSQQQQHRNIKTMYGGPLPPPPSQKMQYDDENFSSSLLHQTGNNNNKVYYGGRAPADIVSLSVQAAEVKEDGQYWFTVEVVREDHSRLLLMRRYNDFWILHVSLLNFFPIESGRRGRPRSIPFMPEPVRDLNQTLAQKRRVQLDTYLQEVWKLKKNIRSSSPMKRFLLKQTGDIETSIGELGFDSSDTLLDLITEYDQSGVVKFKLCLSATTEDYVAWRDTDTISYSQFMDECCVRASRSFIPGLAYKDETSTLIRLMGDEDLRLLTRTNAEKLIFYILENPDSY